MYGDSCKSENLNEQLMKDRAENLEKTIVQKFFPVENKVTNICDSCEKYVCGI